MIPLNELPDRLPPTVRKPLGDRMFIGYNLKTRQLEIVLDGEAFPFRIIK